jgi:integrase
MSRLRKATTIRVIRVRDGQGEPLPLVTSFVEKGRGGERVADFIRLALNTGMRSGELLGLEWLRVNRQAGLIHLEAKDTKAGKRRSVPLNGEARAVIARRLAYRAQHCPASPWVFCHEDGSRVPSVRKAFEGACRNAGIEDFNIHDLRRLSFSEGDCTKYQKSAARSFLMLGSSQKTENKAR